MTFSSGCGYARHVLVFGFSPFCPALTKQGRLLKLRVNRFELQSRSPKAHQKVPEDVTLPGAMLPGMTQSEQLAAQRNVLVRDVELFDLEVRQFSNQLKKLNLPEMASEVFQGILAVRRNALVSARERLECFDQRSHHAPGDYRTPTMSENSACRRL